MRPYFKDKKYEDDRLNAPIVGVRWLGILKTKILSCLKYAPRLDKISDGYPGGKKARPKGKLFIFCEEEAGELTIRQQVVK